MAKQKQVKEEKVSFSKRLRAALRSLWDEFVAGTKAVANLAFVAACGTAAYVLWFSSDSLTLKVVAIILTVRTGCDALRLSLRK